MYLTWEFMVGGLVIRKDTKDIAQRIWTYTIAYMMSNKMIFQILYANN